jgi:hypothetical protein
MYQFSRAIYRELAADIETSTCQNAHHLVLRACEQTVERLATDRHYFARPARTLFNDIRLHFSMGVQAKVWRIVDRYTAAAEIWISQQPRSGFDAQGNPMQCRATTRRGTACQRMPLPHNGYCPSHQHLAETEAVEAEPLAA